MPRWTMVLAVLLWAPAAAAQEYLIRQPTEPASSPVHLTRPVEGRVEVTNLPPVQDVRVVGGSLDSPVTVGGQVEIRVRQPLPVEVVNPPAEPAQPFEVTGTVAIDDRAPVRVVVTNPAAAPAGEVRAARRFGAFVFRGTLRPDQDRARRTFSPPEGKVFHLAGLVIEARDEAARARVRAGAASVRGFVRGAGGAELPLAVADQRAGTGTVLPVPVPLAGPFTLEITAPARAAAVPFTVVATGYLASR